MDNQENSSSELSIDELLDQLEQEYILGLL